MENIDYLAQKAICNALAHDADKFAKELIKEHALTPDGSFKNFLSDFGASLSTLKMQAQDKLRQLQEEETFADQFTK